MPIGTTLGRIINYAWKNFSRNAWIGLATVFVLVLSLLSVNVLVGVNALLERAVTVLEDKVDISVYFKEKTPDQVLQQAQFFIAGLPQVSSAELFTSAQALEQFKKIHADDPKILEALAELDQNPLGAALVIKAKRTEDYPFLLEALKNPQFDFAIETKTYDNHAEAIAQVRDIGKSARLFGGFLIAVFALFSVLIVYNAIRVAIYTQREEIGIMRLVGASGAFVRLPLVLEGVFLAVIALVFSAVIVSLAVAAVEPRLRSLFEGMDPGLGAYYVSNLGRLAVLEGGALMLLVALSSWAAVGKYLKR